MEYIGQKKGVYGTKNGVYQTRRGVCRTKAEVSRTRIWVLSTDRDYTRLEEECILINRGEWQ